MEEYDPISHAVEITLDKYNIEPKIDTELCSNWRKEHDENCFGCQSDFDCNLKNVMMVDGLYFILKYAENQENYGPEQFVAHIENLVALHLAQIKVESMGDLNEFDKKL
jgi:hypothetical protein